MKKTSRARLLRKNQTSQEDKIWNLLRNRNFHGLKFKRQHPIGNYIVDFICIDKKIVIEIDGGQHNAPEKINSDKQRTLYLESEGYKVIRFWNNEIDKNLEGVYLHLQKLLIG